jgi:enoyl-CoA hydratase
MATRDEAVRLAVEDGLGWITLDRQPVLNALDTRALRAVEAALETAEADAAVRVVAITGAGDRAFSAGADISFLAGATAHEVRDLARLAVRVFHRIETLGKPVVAALNGTALGGGLELAESCWLRVAASHARLGHPEVRIGAVAGWGGTTRLARLVGRGRAAELLLTGATLSAGEALAAGLVNRVVPAERLRAEVAALAAELSAPAPAAVRLTWEALHRGLSLSLEESTALGADAFGLAAATEDFREGTRAFLEKRKPAWRGR